MQGKWIGMGILATAAIVGTSIYYLQTYGYYEPVAITGEGEVQLTALIGGKPEAILYEAYQAIDGPASPLKFRACFETAMSLPMLSETYEIYEGAAPLVTPHWFECYQEEKIAAALENGTAIAFVGQRDFIEGIDRVVAITETGAGFVWHQLNDKATKSTPYNE